ncbi:Bud emergence protein 1 [Fusarium oxysporum f. sp. albedinis]|nr:Bud emergence protein 1 [Fusarium oxysporum f. sp. albedinis]
MVQAVKMGHLAFLRVPGTTTFLARFSLIHMALMTSLQTTLMIRPRTHLMLLHQVRLMTRHQALQMILTRWCMPSHSCNPLMSALVQLLSTSQKLLPRPRFTKNIFQQCNGFSVCYCHKHSSPHKPAKRR